MLKKKVASDFLYELYILNYMPKTVFWPLCYISSHGSHVFEESKLKNTILLEDTLRIKKNKFHSFLFSSFRGEDFWMKTASYRLKTVKIANFGLPRAITPIRSGRTTLNLEDYCRAQLTEHFINTKFFSHSNNFQVIGWKKQKPLILGFQGQ